jgi:protein dithiol oxidoreductase (disulfide-forming)
MLKKFFAIIASSFVLITGIAQAAVINKDYTILERPIPQLHKNKIEVLEFFSYNCVHCYHLEPYILKETKTFAPDTYLRPVHVVWDDGAYLNLARIAAAVNSSGLKLTADPAIFNAIFDKKIELWNPKVFNQWAAQQTAFDGYKLIKAYNSLENSAATNKMSQLARQYNITETPIVIVGGKYKVKFSNGFEAGMKTTRELIEKVRNENGNRVANMRKLPKSLGATIAGKANTNGNVKP